MRWEDRVSDFIFFFTGTIRGGRFGESAACWRRAGNGRRRRGPSRVSPTPRPIRTQSCLCVFDFAKTDRTHTHTQRKSATVFLFFRVHNISRRSGFWVSIANYIDPFFLSKTSLVLKNENQKDRSKFVEIFVCLEWTRFWKKWKNLQKSW